MAYKANFENRMDLNNPKDDLEKLVRNLFYQVVQRGGDMFLEYMKQAIDEYIEGKGNQANSKHANCAIFDVSNNEVAVCECSNPEGTPVNKINDKWICCVCNRPLAN